MKWGARAHEAIENYASCAGAHGLSAGALLTSPPMRIM